MIHFLLELQCLAWPCSGQTSWRSTVYYRHKTDRRWSYFALGIGRRPEAARNGPFFIRVRNGTNKYTWQKHETENAARKAAERAPVARKAQELGLVPDDVTNETNKHRVSIKTAVENYLNERRFGRPRSIEVYENVFGQLVENLPNGIRFNLLTSSQNSSRR